MKKLFFATIFSGLMAMGLAACGGGGGSDTASEICDKMVSCKAITSSDVATCKQEVNSGLASVPAKDKDMANALIAECLKMDCAGFKSCIQSLQN